MTRLLLVIVLFITAVKVSYVDSVFLCKHHFASIPLEDEEGKHEKRDQHKSKYDQEDNLFAQSFLSHGVLNPSITLSKRIWEQDTYGSFVKSPSTPPPNRS